MNKKKKTTRLKHRKNQNRMKNLIRASRLKAKPKKVSVPEEIKATPQITAEELKKPVAKKAAVEMAPTKEPTTKKAPAKKKPTKKAAIKKAPAKKSTAKKSPAKKKPTVKKKTTEI